MTENCDKRLIRHPAKTAVYPLNPDAVDYRRYLETSVITSRTNSGALGNVTIDPTVSNITGKNQR